MKKLMLIALAAMLAIPFVGCKKEADKAVDKAAEAIKNATK